MSDSFEFTLHSPLTEEDWNKISDAEHENIMSVTFLTPQGRQVKYIKYEVIDKIRKEIEQHIDREKFSLGGQFDSGLNLALKIIDKYTAEREDV